MSLRDVWVIGILEFRAWIAQNGITWYGISSVFIIIVVIAASIAISIAITVDSINTNTTSILMLLYVPQYACPKI